MNKFPNLVLSFPYSESTYWNNQMWSKVCAYALDTYSNRGIIFFDILDSILRTVKQKREVSQKQKIWLVKNTNQIANCLEWMCTTSDQYVYLHMIDLAIVLIVEFHKSLQLGYSRAQALEISNQKVDDLKFEIKREFSNET